MLNFGLNEKMSLNPPIFLKEREENSSKFVEIQQPQTASRSIPTPFPALTHTPEPAMLPPSQAPH